MWKFIGDLLAGFFVTMISAVFVISAILLVLIFVLYIINKIGYALGADI